MVAAPVFKEIAEECIRYLGFVHLNILKNGLRIGSGTVIFLKDFWFRYDIK